MKNTLSANLRQKYQRLENLIKPAGKVMVAFSGGVDSTFLLWACVDSLSAANVIAGIADGPSLARQELKQACRLAENMQVKLKIVHPDELSDQHYQENNEQRCFFCKSRLFQQLNSLAQEYQCSAVYCGTNADDVNDFRPGRRAAAQYQIVSPLEDAGLTKNDIRQLSRWAQLPTWEKPASPCLASRIAYHQTITAEKLSQIELAEQFIRENSGIRELRVRHHGNLARIEVPAENLSSLVNPEIRTKIVEKLRQIGFVYVSLDLKGFRSGSGNETIRTTGPAKKTQS